MKFQKCYSVFIVFFFLFHSRIFAQEFQANVVVSAPGISTVNKNIFRTLEKSMTEFINTTRWTEKIFKPGEKIKADFYLIVKEYKDNHFQCELNVSAYRPVFHSTYETVTLRISDKNVGFSYLEYQPLSFNPEMLDNNLTAVLAYYAYLILGYDFDSFKLNAGNEFFRKAKEIQVSAAGKGLPGWENEGKFFSRAQWVDQLLSPSNIMFHKAYYTYHRYGLDQMADDLVKGKTNIVRAIQYLEKVPSGSGDLLIKIFFDTKSDEIEQVLSTGPKTVNQKNIVDILMKLAPMYRMKWEKLQ